MSDSSEWPRSPAWKDEADGQHSAVLWARNRQAEVKEPGVRERKTKSTRCAPLCAQGEDTSEATPATHRDGPEQLVRNQKPFVPILTFLFIYSYQLSKYTVQSELAMFFLCCTACCKNTHQPSQLKCVLN